MSLYETLKKSRPDMFRVRLEANSNPCEHCIVRDEKSPEHCDSCLVNPDRRKKHKLSPNSNLIDSIVIIEKG